jgi:hypothetical protein
MNELPASEPQPQPAKPHRRWMKQLPRLFLLLALCWGICSLKGWGLLDGFLVPNVKVSYRGSWVTSGYVLKIVNAGNKPLFNIRVTSRDWNKAYLISSQLDSGSSTEAGWIELPEGIKLGRSYQIAAEGYLLARTIQMPLTVQ